MNTKRRSMADRFWPRILITDGCWLWTGSRSRKGYGAIGTGGRHGPKVLVHRYSWEIHNGPIPDGLSVLHRCDNPPCVNPEHLWLGTIADNNADAKRKGRVRPGHVPGELQGQAKLTDAAVRDIRSDPSPSRILAIRYGVSRTTVIRVRARKQWRHVA